MQTMMDAYDIQQKILDGWRKLATLASGTSVKKDFPQVPVYVILDDKHVTVVDVIQEDNKIILRVKE